MYLQSEGYAFRILSTEELWHFLRSLLDELSGGFFCRRQTNDLVVAAVALLNSHTQDFDPVKVSMIGTLDQKEMILTGPLRRSV